ncbi:unnamed protein product [Caenorhabditis sp. 36 PRJEB53466]|nr:unnamed protein product [Caenorhabditis sp. 36 PRJEB53466]
MESGCVHVRGDVIVESGDEEHVGKLETVRSIFGSLTIDGTNLTSIDFLDDLEYVAALEAGEAAIKVNDNAQLVNVSFPSLKRVRSDIPYSIQFNSNNKQLLMDPSICFGIRNVLNSTENWVPTIDGERCGTQALQI